MTPGDAPTGELLQRWYAGDKKALDDLLQQHLPWIRDQVHRRLGGALREKADTGDIVQDSILQFLKYGPRFLMTNGKQFRALLARIVENVLRDKHDFFMARRRQMAREQPLPTDTVLSLDPPMANVESPSAVMQRREEEAWIRMALELLAPEDRMIIIKRDWDRSSFKEVGDELHITEAAAQMRYHRALVRLTVKVGALRRGQIDRAAEEDRDGADEADGASS